MLNGIIITAVKHPYYGKMAYNLCLTIKAAEPTFSVCCIYDEKGLSHLAADQKEVFDKLIMLDESVPKGCATKLWAYENSPYDNTLILDADMLWLPGRTPSALFNSIPASTNFTSITEGYDDAQTGEHNGNPRYFFWADPEEIRRVHNTSPRVYQWRTEVIFVRKHPQVHALFDYAKAVQQNPGLKTILPYANGIADELAINVACAVMDIHPHEYKWKASYWNRLHGFRVGTIPGLADEYYLVSFGANENQPEQKKLYNTLVKAACFKLGRQHIFTIVSKRDVIPERKKM